MTVEEDEQQSFARDLRALVDGLYATWLAGLRAALPPAFDRRSVAFCPVCGRWSS